MVKAFAQQSTNTLAFFPVGRSQESIKVYNSPPDTSPVADAPETTEFDTWIHSWMLSLHKEHQEQRRRFWWRAASMSMGTLVSLCILGGIFAPLHTGERQPSGSSQGTTASNKADKQSSPSQTAFLSSSPGIVRSTKPSLGNSEGKVMPAPSRPSATAVLQEQKKDFSTAAPLRAQRESTGQESRRNPRKGSKEPAQTSTPSRPEKLKGTVQATGEPERHAFPEGIKNLNDSSEMTLREGVELSSPPAQENSNTPAAQIAPQQTEVTQMALAKAVESPQVHQQAKDLTSDVLQEPVPSGWYRVMAVTPLRRDPHDDASIRTHLLPRTLVKVVGESGDYLKIAATRGGRPPARASLRAGYVRRKDVVLTQSDS